MLTAEKSEKLKALLGRLPAAAAERLARAIEADRMAGGSVLPHDLILSALRRPPVPGSGRKVTPLRLFCLPFEDLMTRAPAREKQKGRIARSNVAALWRWLRAALIPEAIAVFVSETGALLRAGKQNEAFERAFVFWTFVVQEIRIALDKDRRAVRAALGSEAAVADAEEIALLLSIGRDVCEIHNLLVRPVPHLTDEILLALREIHDRIAVNVADAAPYVACIAMNRIERPWEALKLPRLVTHQNQDTLISSTDMGLVGDLLFADIERHGNAIRAARHPAFDADELANHLIRFAEYSHYIVKQIDMRRDGKWGKRLLNDRAAVGETMEGFMERAPKEVAAMLPVQKAGSFAGGPRVADLSKPADPEKVERGMRYAKLVAACTSYAAMASFGAAHSEALEEITEHLRGYNEDLIREMRLAEIAARPAVERQFEIAAELTRLFFSADEEACLRRRAKAALADAA